MSKNIPQHFIDDVIARTDIIPLIQARVNIKKKGQNYLGLCPFHNEKTPSFSVNPQKQFYYCFGCGASGNAISFLMNYDHMEFVDAITNLSHHLGLELPTDNTVPETNHKQDYEILEKAAHFYQQQLRSAPQAIDYLKSRGVTGQIAKHFQLGFAPDEWSSLLHFMADQAITLEMLESNGLAIKKEHGGGYDRFRHRIIFPIRDLRGRVIAFGGRTFTNEVPKYINSPETPLFQKSQELYGLYEVLQHQYHPTSILLVEGYMDVISLHQYGIQNAVATLGTATNPKHLQKLLRYTSEVTFCFDGDAAGQQAAWKSVLMSLPLMRDGIQLRFMFLTGGDDPDSLIRRVGAEGFQQRLQKAEPLSAVFFDLIKQQMPLDTPDSKANYAKKASQYLNQMPNGLFRELMFEQLAKTLQVYVSDLNSLENPLKTKTLKVNPRRQTLLNPAQKAIALLLQEPKLSQQGVLPEHLRHIQAPSVPLLIKLLELYAQNPRICVGEIMAHLTLEEERQEIAYLASRKLPFATIAILAEFSGALERLHQNSIESELQQLIEKSKSSMLTPDEKRKLTELLTERTKTHIQ